MGRFVRLLFCHFEIKGSLSSVGCVLCLCSTITLSSLWPRFPSFLSSFAFHLSSFFFLLLSVSLSLLLSYPSLSPPRQPPPSPAQPIPSHIHSHFHRFASVDFVEPRKKEGKKKYLQLSFVQTQQTLPRSSRFFLVRPTKKFTTIPHITSNHAMPPPMPVDDNIWNLNRYVAKDTSSSHVTTEISYIDFDYVHPMYREGHKYMIRMTNR